MKNKIIILLSLISMMIISGCSAKGAKFNGLKKPLKGTSNVYIYRTSYLGAGVVPKIHKTNLSNNKDEIIGSVKPNGYIMTTITPGMYKFWARTEVKNEIRINASSDQIYCIKHYISPGFFVGHPQFQVVDIKKCKKEIRKTRLSIN